MIGLNPLYKILKIMIISGLKIIIRTIFRIVIIIFILIPGFSCTQKTNIGFHHLDHYIGEEEAAKGIAYRGTNHGHLERPQVLFIDDKPAYLYAATGLGLPKPYGSCSYVFRMRFK
jgi:hypothetical protein